MSKLGSAHGLYGGATIQMKRNAHPVFYGLHYAMDVLHHSIDLRGSAKLWQPT